MTSRSLFFDLLREDLKRRLWSIALSLLTFFFSLPVAMMLQMENLSNLNLTTVNYAQRVLDWSMEILGTGYPLLPLITGVGAVVCGLSSFYYLHSKKKVDFYHSIPVKRELQFAVNYLSGILIYLVPYFVFWLMALAVAACNGCDMAALMPAACTAFGINLLFYWLLYTVAVIAMLLTGHLVVGFLGMCVFYFYGAWAVLLFTSYCERFFDTYASGINGMDIWYWRLSPVLAYGRIVSVDEISKVTVACVVVISLVLTGLALWLHRRRASEMAGKAMAFGPIKPVIRFLLVVAAALTGGIVFDSMQGSGPWLVFGLVCGWLISHAVVEIIYDFDFKSGLNHKLQLAVSGVAILVIACTFQFDLVHYDTYLPAKDKVESMAVNVGNLDYFVDYWREEDPLLNDMSRYSSRDYYRSRMMEITNIGPAYSIAQAAVAEQKKRDGVDGRSSKEMIADDDADWQSVTITYRLYSGRTVYRSYYLDLNTVQQDMKELYVDPAYKQGVFPLLRRETDQYSAVMYSSIRDEKVLDLTQAQVEELLATFQQELTQLSVDDMKAYFPVGEISFVSKEQQEQYEKEAGGAGTKSGMLGYIGHELQGYPVYPTYHNTIALLEKYGVEPYSTLPVDEVKEIRVTDRFVENYGMDFEKMYMLVKEEYGVKMPADIEMPIPQTQDVSKDGGVTVIYNDPGQIASILESSVLQQYSVLNYYRKSDHMVEVWVVMQNDSEDTYHFEFDVEKFPAFVKSDLGYDRVREEYKAYMESQKEAND